MRRGRFGPRKILVNISPKGKLLIVETARTTKNLPNERDVALSLERHCAVFEFHELIQTRMTQKPMLWVEGGGHTCAHKQDPKKLLENRHTGGSANDPIGF